MSKAAKQKQPPPAAAKCEVCSKPVPDPTDLCGCEDCGRLFGPCCNSQEDSQCAECAKGGDEMEGDDDE